MIINFVDMKYIRFLLSPISNNLSFFFFLYVLGILTTLLETWGLGYAIPKFNFLSWIMDVYILCVLLEVVPKRIKLICRIIIFLIAYILSIVDIFCVDTFSAKIGPEIVNVILETNTQESSEFVDKYVNLGLLNSELILIFLLLIIHILFELDAFGLRSFVHSYIRQSVFVKRIRTVIEIVTLFLVMFSFFFCLKSRVKLVQLMGTTDIKKVDRYVSNFSENTPFNNLLFSLKMRQLASLGLNTLKETQDSVKIDSCDYTSSNIVLIIGESYIKCHSQLYGYQLSTTPRQLSRVQMSSNGCLIPFTDVISPSNLTSIVFKNVLSLHSIEDKTDWANYPLFPVLFRRSGFNVTFITNQFVKELNTDIFNVSGGLFINNAKLSEAQFDYRNAKTHQYDLDILSDYDSLKAFNGDYQLTIFHLAGQHIDFNKRSPSNFKKFSIADYANRKQLNNSEKQLVADYDNATYYNDYVVDSILKKFEREDVVIIYMPDHGEECFDELQRMGRLPVGHYSPEVLRQEYRIPFWIWCSNRYIENHPTIFEQIRKSSERPFMTDDLSHLLLYLAGIRCKYYDEKRCLISDSFNYKRKRLIDGKVDYDKNVK